MDLHGFELVKWKINRMLLDLKKEIDFMFTEWGLDSIPPVARYGLCLALISMPVTLVCVLLCCLADDTDEFDEPTPEQIRAHEARVREERKRQLELKRIAFNEQRAKEKAEKQAQ